MTHICLCTTALPMLLIAVLYCCFMRLVALSLLSDPARSLLYCTHHLRHLPSYPAFSISRRVKGLYLGSRAMSWMTKSSQLGMSWLSIIPGCSGANYPTIWGFLLMEGFFITQRVFPRTQGHSLERGRKVMAHRKPIAMSMSVAKAVGAFSRIL